MERQLDVTRFLLYGERVKVLYRPARIIWAHVLFRLSWAPLSVPVYMSKLSEIKKKQSLYIYI